MGQDIVARDEVELHSSCVVLEGQQALPHDGVLLLIRKQRQVSSRLENRAMLATALGSSQAGILGHQTSTRAWRVVGEPPLPRLTFRSWTISTGLWEVKCGEESCLGAAWASVCGRASPGGVLGPEVVGTNSGCFGAA